MSDYIFGANILESLTNGMYQDSRMVLREYIQNSCDAIDAAVRAGILSTDDGKIYITMDAAGRNITIEDNGTGIKAGDFERVMGHIADSEKKQSENKGFRGIGRLCGMAYCRTVRFTAKYQGEDVVSVLTCEAKTMRELIAENTEKKYTAQEVLSLINEFRTEKTEDIDAHYFRVELEGISTSNQYLLDYEKVKEFLSFTAPLPYGVAFAMFRKRIHEHAEGLGLKIDEYNIFLNDEQLFKPYTYRFSTKLGEDEVFDIEFEDFRDNDGNVMAWLWFGVSCLKAQIDRNCPMWGIRLRKGNIQVGSEFTMQKFFKEERGNRYFIGELFCESKGLIPNSQRDYFIENKICSNFEKHIKDYCDELYRLYKAGSDINSSFRKTKQAEESAATLQYRLVKNYFSDDDSRHQAEEELKRSREEAIKEKAKIERLKSSGDIIRKVAERVEAQDNPEKKEGERKKNNTNSKYNQKERAIIAKIFGVIMEELGQDIADTLVRKIEDKLK